jgi:cation diffusion facilitator family transporter
MAKAKNEKHLVALISVLAAVMLTGGKLGVGLWTNSLGILSEALHSGLDLVAAAITLVAVHLADRPADSDHNYGHGKIENFSALIETMLLLLTCVWIIYEAVHRLSGEGVAVDASVYAFATMAVSIIIDFSRSRALARVAKKYDSQALEADALHFSTDIWSSFVVLFGLAGVRIAAYYNIPWLVKADAVAALGVAMIVIYVGGQLAWKSISDLIDTVPEDLGKKIGELALVPGVVSVKKVRTRKSGAQFFADVVVVVESGLSLERSHAVATQVEAAVQKVMERGLDVVVHIEPDDEDPSDAASLARALAERFGMSAHEIRFPGNGNGQTLELHLEVDHKLSLQAAHDLVTRFEEAFLGRRDDFSRVISHIEPVAEPCADAGADRECHDQVLNVINDFFMACAVPCRTHDLHVARTGNGREYNISLHCGLSGSESIVDAHEIITRLERHLHVHLPNLGRVTIHVEPMT